MRGANPGEYADKDIVVIIDPKSRHYGEVGVVEVRPGDGADVVHLGRGAAVLQFPQDIRRVRPGDRIIQP